jgi:AcrR family transcriptional regulator
MSLRLDSLGPCQLAKRFRVNRTTFYRHYSPIAAAMLDQAAQHHSEGPKRRRPPDDSDDRDHTIRRLRDENSDLRRHLEIYEEHLRILTIENKRQKEQLEQIAGVSDLSARRIQ